MCSNSTGLLHKPSLLDESFDFIKSVNRRCGRTPALYSQFPLKYWTSTECLISSVVRYFQAHTNGAQSYTYGVNCNWRMLEKFFILYWFILIDNTDYYCSQLYNNRPLGLLGQFFVITNRILTKGKGKSVLSTLSSRIVGEGLVLHSFLTSALDGGDWWTSRPGRCTPGKESRYPLNRTLGGPQNRSGRYREEESLFPLLAFDPRTLQPVTYSRCTVPTTLSRFTEIVVIYPDGDDDDDDDGMLYSIFLDLRPEFDKYLMAVIHLQSLTKNCVPRY